MRMFRQSGSHSAAHAIPGYLRLFVATGLSMLALLLITISGSLIAGYLRRSDPFAIVRDLFRAGAWEAARTHGFTCQSPAYSLSLTGTCSRTDTSQRPADIYARITNDTANEVDLRFADNTLTLGDLILIWGNPVNMNARSCETQVDSWSISRLKAIVIIPESNRMDYFTPVRMVSFMGAAVPYREYPLLADTIHGC